MVEITNLTDAPGRKPKQIDIYNKTLNPGDALRLPAELVDRKIRSLEETGDISIGQAPAWYMAVKAKKSRRLTDEEVKNHLARKEVKALVPPPTPTAVKSKRESKKLALGLVDVNPTQDELSLEQHKNQRRQS